MKATRGTTKDTLSGFSHTLPYMCALKLSLVLFLHHQINYTNSNTGLSTLQKLKIKFCCIQFNKYSTDHAGGEAKLELFLSG